MTQFFNLKTGTSILIGACVLTLAGCNLLTQKPAVNPDPNHTHADFAVWIDGKQLDFSDAKYMSGSSKEENQGDHPHEHLHEYLHLHDGNGHVIHSHKPGLTFGEFLESLGLQMKKDPEKDGSVSCLYLEDGTSYCGEGWDFVVNGMGVHCPVLEKGHILCPYELIDGLEEAWSYNFSDTDTLLLTFGATEDEVHDQLKKLTNDACLYSQTCPERGKPPVENCIADPAVPCVE